MPPSSDELAIAKLGREGCKARLRTGGEQKVTVQHVTVNEGGQAIVGSVSPQVGGMGDTGKARDSPVHRLPDWRVTLPLAQSCPRCGARTRSGAACKAPSMPNGRCRMHGGMSTGAPARPARPRGWSGCGGPIRGMGIFRKKAAS
jgi:ribosomal protein L32